MTIKFTKHHIRKADRQVKHRSIKQKDLHRAMNSTLASPPIKVPISRIDSHAFPEHARTILFQIQKLMEKRDFRSEELYEAVEVLKSLFSKANEGENSGAESIYKILGPEDCSMLSQLLSNDVGERTKVKAIGIFVQLSYSGFASLIVQSQPALEQIVIAMSSVSNAVRVRAIACIANLAQNGIIRDVLVEIPQVVSGLITNLDVNCRKNQNMDLVVIARDTCWAINNIFSAEPKILFTKMQRFLEPLIRCLASVEDSTIKDDENGIALIRFGLRALENALDSACIENLDCSLHHDRRLIHFLSWCLRYRRYEKTRDIAIAALICIGNFSLESFLEENFIMDLHKTFVEERQKGAEARSFLITLCRILASMIKNGTSSKMKTSTVSKITNGLFTLTHDKWRCSHHDLRRYACLALSELGRSLGQSHYIDAFWSAGGGNGLLVAISLNVEPAVNYQALVALIELLSITHTLSNSYLLSKPKLRDLLKESVEKLLYSHNDVLSEAANSVMTQLEKLEETENRVSSLAQSQDVKLPQSLPPPKRRRVELGAFNS